MEDINTTSQDCSKDRSDYVGDNWYIVFEQFDENPTERVFLNKQDAKEFFKLRCYYAKHYYPDNEKLRHKLDNGTYIVDIYNDYTERWYELYILKVFTFSEYLKVILERWINKTTIDELFSNEGNPYPYLVPLVMFDSNGLTEPFVKDAFTYSENTFVSWVSAFAKSDPRRLHEILYEIATPFFSDRDNIYTKAPDEPCVWNTYVSHSSKPIGSIHIVYQDVVGLYYEEQYILEHKDMSDDDESPEQEIYDGEELPF